MALIVSAFFRRSRFLALLVTFTRPSLASTCTSDMAESSLALTRAAKAPSAKLFMEYVMG